MKMQEFKNHVDIHGADLSRWPLDRVKPALALMQADTKARAHFDAAMALDEKLRLYDAPRADLAALEDRIVAAARADAAPPPAIPAFLPRAGAGGLLAAALVGFIIGVLPPAGGADTLLDPVFYTQDQIITGGESFNAEDIF